MIKLAWLIPLLPLIGSTIIGFGGKKLSKQLVTIIGCGAVLLAFLLSAGIFFQLHGTSNEVKVIDWIAAGKLHVDFAFLIDPLSTLFLLIITGIGFLIHVYSVGYMHDDEKYDRFFCYLNLFVFFMLLLVMGNNYALMFVGWEGVGLCSYLLIGFWFKNTSYNNAAKKAFIVNRIGDLGFLIGMIMIYSKFGGLDFASVFSKASSVPQSDVMMLNSIGILLFIGACGKSAQIPLYTWLPDAMAGPTPVSALIHAATMVTAGVYMIARSSIIFAHAEIASAIVAFIGLLTLLFAATIGLFQNDIKKVLAYSTVSQLGYMFLGLGVGAYTGAVFHVTTHAFFKALLFLAAGSVIHGMSGEQDIRRMGGLRKKLPITHLVFLIGTIAISGIPPFSGFFSKDEILGHVYEHNKIYWMLGVIGSMMTAFYMFRLYFLTFWGDFRGTHDQEHHLHESPKSMTVPLMVLAVLSVVGGFIGIPMKEGWHLLENFLKPVVGDATFRMSAGDMMSHAEEVRLMVIAVVAAAAAIYFAYSMYVKNEILPKENESEMSTVQRTIFNKYYVDEFYDAIIRKPLDWCSDKLYRFFELRVVDGFVNFIGTSVRWTSSVARYAQSGNVDFYVFAMVIAVIAILLIKLF
ncbi:MAG TPA: NADH-quinone oxidoreductase subunit L [Bacteroidia bacterium]|jgi:NADH-quinone oxidoreductase subunit L|nr:NADH-quinone oxidoreductase subunit L [Bacteroidia bacterium]